VHQTLRSHPETENSEGRVTMVALGGFVVGGTLHVFNHAVDSHLGGHASDTWLLAGHVLLAAAALGLHLRSRLTHGHTVP
jgi:hypothetical protein